jgi:4-amino-4-deoxy-L-arabinose transferase-like glycosyltransferase
MRGPRGVTRRYSSPSCPPGPVDYPPLSALGLLSIRPSPARARLWLFLGVVLLASAVGLVRLHATTGYCTVRRGLIPGTILLLAAAHGATWLLGRLYVPGKWLGLPLQHPPGPAMH